MPTFVLLTRPPPDAAWTPEALEALRREAMRRLRDDGAEVEWINDCVFFGPYHHLDVFHVPSVEAAAQAATLVLVHGRVSLSSQADLAAEG